MPNVEHLAVLREGVDAWNTWRRQNPEIRPDLSGSEREPFDLNEALKNTPVWDILSDKTIRTAERRDEKRLILQGINLSGANLSYSIFDRSVLMDADLSNANLVSSDLSYAIMALADLSQSTLANADLEGAHMAGCILREADLEKANIRRINLSRATVTDANFRDVNWRDCRFTRHVPARGLDSLQNEPNLKLFWKHQLRIEAMCPNESLAPREVKDWVAIHRPLQEKLPWVLGLVGGLAGIIASDGNGALETAWLSIVISNVVMGALLGVALGAGLSSYWGQKVRYSVWGLLGFGRSWGSVAVLGAVLIVVFGSLYSTIMIPYEHIELIEDGSGTVSRLVFYPWYVAAMAFSTLGITDLARPVSGVGQLFLISNVLCGFFVFGLLISTLGNSFHKHN